MRRSSRKTDATILSSNEVETGLILMGIRRPVSPIRGRRHEQCRLKCDELISNIIWLFGNISAITTSAVMGKELCRRRAEQGPEDLQWGWSWGAKKFCLRNS